MHNSTMTLFKRKTRLYSFLLNVSVTLCLCCMGCSTMGNHQVETAQNNLNDKTTQDLDEIQELSTHQTLECPPSEEMCDADRLICDEQNEENLNRLESCNGLDDDCDRQIDEGFEDNEELCNGIDDNCNGDIDEGFEDNEELCNGIDDNCNGDIDEGFADREEQCNGVDDDCDGRIDEAFAETEERCNGIDDDCDGTLDEGFVDREEECNGIDDDCDGILDEGIDLTTDIHNCGQCGQVCSSNLPNAVPLCEEGACILCGEIGEGENECECTISEEICDGIDNDCNGQIDDVEDIGDSCILDVSFNEHCGSNGQLQCNVHTQSLICRSNNLCGCQSPTRRPTPSIESSYLICNHLLPFHLAQDTCTQLGGHLMIIETEEEHEWILSQIGRLPRWMGLSRREDGNFYWEDGVLGYDVEQNVSPYYFEDFCDNEPNNFQDLGEDCVEWRRVLACMNGTWNDESCENSKAFICELPQQKLIYLWVLYSFLI